MRPSARIRWVATARCDRPVRAPVAPVLRPNDGCGHAVRDWSTCDCQLQARRSRRRSRGSRPPGMRRSWFLNGFLEDRRRAESKPECGETVCVPGFTTPGRSTIMIRMADLVLTALSNLPDTLPAVEDRTGSWTRADLRRSVASAHHYFSRNGIGIGDRVAIVTGDDKRVVAALLGARAAGALVCPIDPADAEGQAARIRPRLVIAAGRVPGVDAIDVGALLADSGPSLPIVQGGASAWGVATSGSSGPPKTVVLTESSVAHVTAAIQDLVRYNAQDRIHGGLPLHHTYGLSQLMRSCAL